MGSESEYRKVIQHTLDRIEQGLENVDPDLAECSQALGALTIILGNGARCILSAQPSVRQLWLALAKEGIAYHFVWDAAKQCWLDDREKGVELLTFLNGYLEKVLNRAIEL